jgi:glucokinase
MVRPTHDRVVAALMVTAEISHEPGLDAPEPPGTLAIGLDVGGSKIAACLFDVGSRTSLATRRTATRPSRGGGAVLEGCVTAVEGLVAEAGVDAARTPLGIGVCELVGPDGEITTAANFDWRGLDVASHFRSPVLVVESDVRSAAYAEAWIGAGAGHRSFVYLTVGTGIAFTLVLDSRPHVGARGNALILGAPPVESISSGAALAAAAGLSTAQEVFARPELGSIVDEAAAKLGAAMAWLVNALDPELIVMGGGLGLRRQYREAAAAAMRPHIEARASRDVPVVPAALGADAGAIGAAFMAATAARGR